MTTHVEPLLVSWLKAAFPTARLCTETPADLVDVLPVLQVVGIGGTGDRFQFDEPRADVDVFGASRDAARTLAQQVRASLLEDLPGQMVDGAMVLSTKEFMSPVWTPYDNTAVRRFTLSVGLRLHTRSLA
jgi:hypothetical protein